MKKSVSILIISILIFSLTGCFKGNIATDNKSMPSPVNTNINMDNTMIVNPAYKETYKTIDEFKQVLSTNDPKLNFHSDELVILKSCSEEYILEDIWFCWGTYRYNLVNKTNSRDVVVIEVEYTRKYNNLEDHKAVMKNNSLKIDSFNEKDYIVQYESTSQSPSTVTSIFNGYLYHVHNSFNNKNDMMNFCNSINLEIYKKQS